MAIGWFVPDASPVLPTAHVGAGRGALSMVKLSEDPARHDHLSESIVSCFCTSDQPKSTGGAVDFTQFADVMACQVRSSCRSSEYIVDFLSVKLNL